MPSREGARPPRRRPGALETARRGVGEGEIELGRLTDEDALRGSGDEARLRTHPALERAVHERSVVHVDAEPRGRARTGLEFARDTGIGIPMTGWTGCSRRSARSMPRPPAAKAVFRLARTSNRLVSPAADDVGRERGGHGSTFHSALCRRAEVPTNVAAGGPAAAAEAAPRVDDTATNRDRRRHARSWGMEAVANPSSEALARIETRC
jgi:hypothetical protein